MKNASARPHSKCPICGYPTISERGTKIHLGHSHNGSRSERNREIVRMWHAYYTVAEIAETFALHPQTVYYIAWRSLAYPKIYEPQRGTFAAVAREIHEGVTPIRRRA